MNGYYTSPYGASQHHDQFFQYPQHVQYEQEVHGHSQQHRHPYQTRQQVQQHPYQSVYSGPLEDRAIARAHLDRLISGLSSSGNVNAPAHAMRDSFMRSAVAAAAHSPVYEQHSQMMHLPHAGRYDLAFNGYADAQVHQRSLQNGMYNHAHPALKQHNMHPSAEFAQYQHHTDSLARDYRQAHAAHHALNTSVPGMVDEAQLYAQQGAGLQPAFEPNNAAWQHASHPHMQYGNPPMHGEEFETGWHAGHYSSPTHHLGQEMYAGAELADTFDYPTFLRPAELASSYQHQESAVPVGPVADMVSVADEPQLIASDASAIPPPLPIEKSAHPLAALATDLVWEAFLAAANHNSPASSSSSQFSNSSNERSPSSGRSKAGSSPATSRYSLRSSVSPTVEMHKRSSSKSTSPLVTTWNRSRLASAGPDADNASSNVYGAIGGERKPRLSIESSPGSDSSSPASTAPGTPAMDAWMVTEAGHAGRLGGQGYWNEEDAMENGKHSLPPISSLLRPAAAQRFGSVTAPYALYDQIQKLLSATLLSQQVLLLALYYIARVPHTSPLYPPATSQSALQSTSAPFKLLLAALVVANKVSTQVCNSTGNADSRSYSTSMTTRFETRPSRRSPTLPYPK